MDIRKRLLRGRQDSLAARSGRRLRFDSGVATIPKPHIPLQPGGWVKSDDAPPPTDEDDTHRNAA